MKRSGRIPNIMLAMAEDDGVVFSGPSARTDQAFAAGGTGWLPKLVRCNEESLHRHGQ